MFAEAHFQDEDAARDYLENLRWPEGPVCPHCGCTGNTTKLNVKRQKGLHMCNDCRKEFTVTIGTIFERSHVKLNIWLQAFSLLCSNKKGISACFIQRQLGVTYKTAWFMLHRIREAMRDDTLGILGGGDSIVEADETYWGNIPGKPKAHAWHHKEKIVSLVERGGCVRSFHVDKVSRATLRPIMEGHIAQDTRIMTDEASYYHWCASHFTSRETVAHKHGEYSRGDVTTNTVEGFFSILKRGLIGTYHHVDGHYLTRYLDEFDFRYNTRDLTDTMRMVAALKGAEGKRITYYC